MQKPIVNNCLLYCLKEHKRLLNILHPFANIFNHNRALVFVDYETMVQVVVVEQNGWQSTGRFAHSLHSSFDVMIVVYWTPVQFFKQFKTKPLYLFIKSFYHLSFRP
jgi:hypothetical protein